MTDQTPSQRHTAKLRAKGRSTYLIWVPNDPVFKERIKIYRDKILPEFLRDNDYDPKLKKWIPRND